MSKHFLRMRNEWLEVQRSCLHLCCRPFPRTPLKGFTTPKSQLSITPSHSRVGTHTHTHTASERTSSVHTEERAHHRMMPQSFLLAEAKHSYPSNRRNSYSELLLCGLLTRVTTLSRDSCLTEATTPHRQKRLPLDWGEEMRVPNEQDGSLKIQDFRGKGCTEMQKLIT